MIRTGTTANALSRIVRVRAPAVTHARCSSVTILSEFHASVFIDKCIQHNLSVGDGDQESLARRIVFRSSPVSANVLEPFIVRLSRPTPRQRDRRAFSGAKGHFRDHEFTLVIDRLVGVSSRQIQLHALLAVAVVAKAPSQFGLKSALKLLPGNSTEIGRVSNPTHQTFFRMWLVESATKTIPWASTATP